MLGQRWGDWLADRQRWGDWLGDRQPTYPLLTYQGLLRAYQPLVSLNKALLNHYFWEGGYVARGGVVQ